MQKNYSIEFFRFVFMLILAIWHFNELGLMHHGYLVVEFFFILSGMLIYGSYERKNIGTLEFTLRKLRRFYPKYVIVLCVMLALKANTVFVPTEPGLDGLLDTVLGRLPEFLLLQNVGVYPSGINYPLWYLCVLLLGGGVLYGLLRINRRLCLVLLPLYVVGYYGWLFSRQPSIEDFGFSGPFYMPLYRGMADMGLGFLLKCLADRYEAVRAHVLDACAVVSVVLLVVTMFTVKAFDRYSLVFISFLLLACFNTESLVYKSLNRKVWATLGGITYEMLLLHYPVRSLTLKISPPPKR